MVKRGGDLSEERFGDVTFKGQPLTAVGLWLKPGDKAPDFTVINGRLEEVSSSFKKTAL